MLKDKEELEVLQKKYETHLETVKILESTLITALALVQSMKEEAKNAGKK